MVPGTENLSNPFREGSVPSHPGQVWGDFLLNGGRIMMLMLTDNVSRIIEDICNTQQRLENSLASDHHSRSAYIGQVRQTEQVTIWDENGQYFEKEVSFLISWDSISKILELARKRAGI